MVVCGTIEEFLFLGLVGDNQGLWMDVLIARGLQPRSLFADRESRTSSACGTIIILTKFMWGYELQALGIPFHATILFTYLRIFLSFIEVLLHNIKLNSLVYDTWISMFPLLGGSWDMLYLDERLCGTIIILTKVMWGYELQALGIPFHATILFTYLRIFLSFIERRWEDFRRGFGYVVLG
ncbi:uncharacterized protein LOC122076931 isoform X2 [Macadamia integrifolia]|uniref:uncharacterized protein LOC122076931 isoform X2 n=1 Tax=Macadamia integrifolia TaxID=60698 RepID=UPI001C501D25|nr:uncharacterized protein LOC122076931 isoform X2 [Macadamia integrifolia]